MWCSLDLWEYRKKCVCLCPLTRCLCYPTWRCLSVRIFPALRWWIRTILNYAKVELRIISLTCSWEKKLLKILGRWEFWWDDFASPMSVAWPFGTVAFTWTMTRTVARIKEAWWINFIVQFSKWTVLDEKGSMVRWVVKMSMSRSCRTIGCAKWLRIHCITCKKSKHGLCIFTYNLVVVQSYWLA